jgi:ABC-2 type transport system permease protein
MGNPRIAVVARHEFVSTVTRAGYLLTLLGTPLFVAGISGVSGYASYQGELSKRAEKRSIALVDEAGLFASTELRVPLEEQPEEEDDPAKALKQGAPQPAQPIELVRFSTLEAATAALRADEVGSVLRIPRDYLLQGRVEQIVRPPRGLTPGDGRLRRLRPWMVRSLLAGQAGPELVTRAAQPFWQTQTLVLEPDGSLQKLDLLRELRPLLVPMGFAMLLLLSIFTSAAFLATGLAEEKQNRALELMLTSVTPEQLFWGKLLGIGAAALLQFLIYLAIVALPAAAMFSQLEVHLSQVLSALGYFVLGFFFYGSVLLAVGAIGNTQKYTQQLSGMFTFAAVIPMMVLEPILSKPDGVLARVLTFIPFTAPITGMLRAGAGGLPWWELLLSYLVLALGCWVAVTVSAKVFRVALLATGTVPSLRQVWRWMRG